MKKREKMLAIVVAAALGLAVGYLLLKSLFLGPLAEKNANLDSLRQQIADFDRQNAKAKGYNDSIKKLAAMAFDADELRTSEKARARLGELLERCGLGGERMSLQPVNGPVVKDTYREIGWNVRARGTLDQVINFLYLADGDPRLHQIDQLSITPVSRSPEVDLSAHYSTLVLLPPAKGGKSPAAGLTPAPLAAPQTDTPGRKLYGLIASRDLLRPYIPRPPQTPETPAVAQNPQPTAPDDPGYWRMRVVGLPSWDGGPNIIISDAGSRSTKVYHPGDALAGGKIVMVDYRSLPMPNKPQILSGSRVILAFEQEFWAVELGQSLADRHRLDAKQLPAELQSSSKAAPVPVAGG